MSIKTQYVSYKCLILIFFLAFSGVAKAAGDSEIRGEVLGAKGGGLPGAIIILEETGEKRDSDENGRFRFTGLNPGTYFIRVEYIGYQDVRQQVTVKDTGYSEVQIAIASKDSQGPVLEEVAVYGSAIQSALNQQRAASNVSNVVAATELGRLPDSTVAESLRRLPGISFQRDERSGEGEYISIRGMDSGFNNIQINGVNSASAGGERRVPLDILQAGSISKVKINKSLLPEHEGEGIGGSVELETQSALQIKNRIVRFSVEGDRNDFREKTGTAINATFADSFGADENFGLLLSASYRKRYFLTNEIDVLSAGFFPTILPTTTLDGDPVSDLGDVSILRPYPFTEGVSMAPEDVRWNQFHEDKKDVSMTIALDWSPADHTLLALIANLNNDNKKRRRNTFGFDQDDNYGVRTVNGVDRVVYLPDDPEFRIRGEVTEDERNNDTFVFRGETLAGKWTFNYQVGYAKADDDRVRTMVRFREGTTPASYFVANPDGPTDDPYISLDTTNKEFPVPRLSAEGYAAIADPSIYDFYQAYIRDAFSEDERKSGEFDFRFEPDHPNIRFIGGGLKYEQSDRRTFNVEREFWRADSGISLADSGFLSPRLTAFDEATNDLQRVGVDGFLTINQDALDNASAIFADFASRGIIRDDASGPDSDNGTQNEEILAAYFTAAFDLGEWELIGGVRVERTEQRINALSEVDFDFDNEVTGDNPNPTQMGFTDIRSENQPVVNRHKYTDVLPRFQLNYRPSESWVYRAALWTSIARPRPSDLSGAIELSYDGLDNELIIETGNPDLEPSYAINFDLGAEYYGENGLFVSVNLYHKKIDDFIYGLDRNASSNINDIDLSDFQAIDDILAFNPDIELDTKVNGRDATVTGVEMSVYKTFKELSGFWNGFGVFANLTIQETEAEFYFDNELRKASFFNAPDYVGSVQVFYEKGKFDAALTYSFQDKQVDEPENYLFDEYEQAYKSLDLKLGYDVTDWFEIYLRASDITDSGDKPINVESRGPGIDYLDDVQYNGRTIRAGIIANF